MIMAYHPSARFQGRVNALNRARDRLDAARAEVASFAVFGYQMVATGMPRGAFYVHDTHGRYVGKFMPDGRFLRAKTEGDKLAPGFAAALRLLAGSVDEADADALPAMAI